MTAVTLSGPPFGDAVRMVNAEGFATLAAEQLARLTRSSLRTVRRWRAAGMIPAWAHDLLTLLLDRPLGMLCAGWDGWHLRTGALQAPNGWEFSPGELLSIPLRLQQLRALELELVSIRNQQAERRAREQVVHPVAPRRHCDFFDHELTLALAKPAVTATRRQALTPSHGETSLQPWPSASLRPGALQRLPEALPLRD